MYLCTTGILTLLYIVNVHNAMVLLTARYFLLSC